MAKSKLTLEVIGDPVPKARPRVVRQHGRSITYTPARSQAYVLLVQSAARAVDCFAIPDSAPLRISMRFVQRRNSTSRPDLNNLVANILDALNGIWYRDDAQVVEIHATKEKGPVPKVIIEAEPLLPDPPQSS